MGYIGKPLTLHTQARTDVTHTRARTPWQQHDKKPFIIHNDVL